MKATHLVVSTFCVGESFSLPLLHASSRLSTHPLTRAVQRCIVDDEAEHASFGWTYLDWVAPHLSAQDRLALGVSAQEAIGDARSFFERLSRASDATAEHVHNLGSLTVDELLELGEHTIEKQVFTPLHAHGCVTF